MAKEKLWTKNFIVVSLINFLLILVYFLLMVSIAGYAVKEFNASTSTAGLVSGIFIIGALIGRLWAGRYIINAGSRKTMMAGLLLFILATASYFFASNLPLLLVNRLVHGIALGTASTATGTIIAQVIPQARRGEGIGFYSLSTVLATAIGPFLGILFSQSDGYSSIFVFNLALALVSLLVSFIVDVPVRQPGKTVQPGFGIRDFIERSAVPISIVAMVIGFSYSGVISFLSFYAEKIGLMEASGYFFLVYSLILLISRPFSGKLFDSKGANIIIYPCLLIFAAGLILFSAADSGWVLLAAGALIGLGYGNFISVAQTVSLQSVPAERLGLATSTFFIFYDAGLGAGPYLLGFLVTLTGYRGLYLVTAFVILASIPLYYFVHGKNNGKFLRKEQAA